MASSPATMYKPRASQSENKDEGGIITTPGEKASKTARERRERREQALRERVRDSEQAVAVCRAIRDDENAADADRLEAIRILKEFTA